MKEERKEQEVRSKIAYNKNELRGLFEEKKKEKEKVKTWEDTLERRGDKIVPSYVNHVLLWENHEMLKNMKIAYNEFFRQVEVNGEVINDRIWSTLRNRFEMAAGFTNKQKTEDFVNEYCYKFRYNPVIDFLDSVRGKTNENIKCKDAFIKWFDIKYDNDEEKRIIERLSEKWFVSAIKRIYEPGCAIEGMIVIVGKQGIGKSEFINKLTNGYAVEAAFNIEDEKKSAETLNRCWVCNFDEFKSLDKKEPQVVKEYLTKRSETTRLAYRHEPEEFKRHCVFISSTNNSNILKDYTGNEERRFWVFESQLKDNRKIFNEFSEHERDALWADALSIYENNKNYNISRSDFDSHEMSIFIKLQRQFKTFMQDDAMDLVRELLNRKYKLDEHGEFKTLEEFKQQINEPLIGACDTLQRIPISWINVVMQTLYHTSRKNDKIAAAMSDEFIYKKGYCNGGHCMCLIRIDSLKGQSMQLFE